MGTPDFAVPSLAGLIAAGHDILAVYTQPPRPSGRGHKLKKSPVHEFADEHGLEVRTPESLKSAEEKQAFADLDAEVAVVVAYGLILPKAVLAAPEHGCLNLHGSLLPRWRGAAPIQRAIMAGDELTGVQVMQMEAGLDTGPILLSETVPLDARETAASLSEKLSHIGAGLLPVALAALGRGGLVPQPQPEEGVTYAHKITAEEARIDWTRPAVEIDAHIRGLTPVPGAWTLLPRDGEEIRLKISGAEPVEADAAGKAPGTLLTSEGGEITIAAGEDTALRLTRLQRPGKAAQDADTFLRGFALSPGDQLV